LEIKSAQTVLSYPVVGRGEKSVKIGVLFEGEFILNLSFAKEDAIWLVGNRENATHRGVALTDLVELSGGGVGRSISGETEERTHPY